jgi:HEPN domain-containing protein
MSEFDNFIRGLGSDIKNAAEHVGKKAEETFEISKRRAERIKIKGHIQSLYQRLGELTYGGMKNGEDVSEEAKVLTDKLDEAFARIEELFEEINEIKNGTFVPEQEMDWEEEYAEEYDDEDVEVSIVVMENDGEVVEEPAVIEAEEEETSADVQEFDINID